MVMAYVDKYVTFNVIYTMERTFGKNYKQLQI